MTSSNILTVGPNPPPASAGSRRGSSSSGGNNDQTVLERFWITLDKQHFSPGEKVTGVVSLVVVNDDDDVSGRPRTKAKRKVYLRVKALWLDFNVYCDMVMAEPRRRSSRAGSVVQEVI